MSVSHERLDEIVASMLGSCHDLDYYLEEGEELSLEDLHYIDQEVIECTDCGWNVDAYTVDDEGRCGHCSE